ncbi:cytochrome P450 [Rhodospirillaceae bacterium SYSU D60014]|uniref:cytochrome P450 n=1 Tax=Virgifigura deserti TaxID=2268457 RepID=UPI0013C53274
MADTTVQWDTQGAAQGAAPSQRRRTPPGPAGLPIVGIGPEIRRDPLAYLTSLAQRCGDVVHLNLGRQRVFLLNHPNHVAHVLQANYRNYRKSDFYDKVRPTFGDGLVTSEGDFWRRQRKLAQPAFHRERIEALAKVMTDATGEMLRRWESTAAQDAAGGATLDITTEMFRLTLDIVLRSLFGADLRDDFPKVAQSVATMLEISERRMWAFVDLQDHLPTRNYWRTRHAVRTLDEVVYRIIAERRRSGERRDDLLGMLLEARDADTGEGMSDRQLRDEVTTLLVAGHETTANALTWIWYLLSKHPQAARQVRAEIDTVCGGRMPNAEDARALTYTKLVIQEAMRLYPPAWTISRAAIEDDEIGGYAVPAGSPVMLCPYIIHRHTDYWENPEGFDPERFLPERSVGRPKFAYFPFGGGPRICIGNSFAMMEIPLVLAMAMRAYDLHLVPGHRVEPLPAISLRPKNGMIMSVRRRAAAAKQAA